MTDTETFLENTNPLPTLFQLREIHWSVGPVDALEDLPTETVPATVPGAVQLDWAKAHGWPEPGYDLECEERYRWMEDKFWVYTTRIDCPTLAEDQELVFACGGVDYACTVFLDEERVHEQEGMQVPFELNLDRFAGRSIALRIVVHPAPKPFGELEKNFKKNASLSAKPAFNYGWDFHPRLISLGIWRATQLLLRPVSRLASAEVHYHLSEDLESAQVWLDVHASRPGKVLWTLEDPADQEVVHVEHELAEAGPAKLSAELPHPQLWWPHDQGQPALYRSRAQWFSAAGEMLGDHTADVGFRRIKLVMNDGAWDIPAQTHFPKTRSEPPMQLEINGRRIFLRGSNAVSPDTFAGRVTRETWQPLLDCVVEANFNTLRMWGGSPAQDDAFFEECDRRGILVWQEFPLACNEYSDDPRYLEVLDRDSRALIQRIRHHACLAIWCGGNELLNSWSGMTDQHLALRLLNHNCYALDPHRPFLASSPLMGVVHGGYNFVIPNGLDVLQYTQAARPTAFVEIGCAGPAPAKVLDAHMPEARRILPDGKNDPEADHRFWHSGRAKWFGFKILDQFFDGYNSLDDYLEKMEWLQSEAIKAIYEEARRQKPRCSMALNWCLNEPTLNFANNSLLAWPAEPKAAFTAAKAACRPVLASARIPKFSWKPGETVEIELFLLNDSPEDVQGGKMFAKLVLEDHEIPSEPWQFPKAERGRNIIGPKRCFSLPTDCGTASKFKLLVEIQGQPGYSTTYTLRLDETAPFLKGQGSSGEAKTSLNFQGVQLDE